MDAREVAEVAPDPGAHGLTAQIAVHIDFVTFQCF